MSTPDREYRLSGTFVALADTLVDDYDVIDLLDTLARHCVSLVAADGVGILFGDARQELRAAAASSEDAATMGQLQLQSDQGPCLDSFSNVVPVAAPDITEAAQRWPRFVGAVAESGSFQSVHALPLRLREQVIGAVGLFRRRPGRLPAADLELGQALADVATIGILTERSIRRGAARTGQLQTALDTRVVIEQAKGVIAHGLSVGMDEAFDRLRRYCRSHNLRVGEVARQVAAGDMDVGVIMAAPPPASVVASAHPGARAQRPDGPTAWSDSDANRSRRGVR